MIRMSTDVNNGAKKRIENSDFENSMSDVDSDKLMASSNEEDEDADGKSCEAI